MTKNWIELSDLPSSQHSVNKNIRFKSSMLTSDLCGRNEKLVEMSRHDEYTTGNLSDYLYHQSIISSLL